MCADNHDSQSVDDAVIEVCGDIVQERFNKLIHVYCCLSLLCAYGIECYKQLIINNLCIIQEGPNNFLNAFDGFLRQECQCIFVCCILGLLVKCNWCCSNWQKLGLFGHGPVQAEKKVVDIRFHVNVYSLAGEIPLDI
jgi:hypothetical protein